MGEPRTPQPYTLEQRLLDAIARADRPSAERALELGADLRATDELGRGAVIRATKDAADLDLIRWLTARGAPLDEPDVNGRTALGFAAGLGRLDIARWLVDAGAVPDRPDGQKLTPLFHAAFGDHADVAALLLDRGADVNARDQFGDTPLMVACAKGHAATAALLLARGADPSLTNQEGRTARARSAPGTAPCTSLGPP